MNVLHDTVLLVMLATIWLIPAGLSALVAHRRGHSFALFLIAALVVLWPIPLLAALTLPERSNSETKERK